MAFEAGTGPPRSDPANPADRPDRVNPRAAQRPSVLLAEDDDSLRSMLELVLRREGYDVEACSDGMRALEALARAAAGEAHIDVALLDLRMPGASGAELLAQIRQTEALRSLRVIAMSGFSDAVQAEAARAAGADEFLPKPFSVARLTAMLRALVPVPHRS